jgi:hypothetical protein
MGQGCMKYLSLIFLLQMTSTVAFSQASGIRTYCNPMDINYQYNFEQINEKISYRSGADPVIVNHKGDYYLFVTISGGWWHSKDLLHWDYVGDPGLLSMGWQPETGFIKSPSRLYFWVSTRNHSRYEWVIGLSKTRLSMRE